MSKTNVDEWLQEERLLVLEGWARDGLTDDQIAENMGISVRTLYRWKKQYCHICHALKKGKDVADREIENALFKRAKGYDFTETRVKRKGGIVVEETVITKHIPGDTTAQIFWLKNRKPEYWGGGDRFTEEDDDDVILYIPDNGRDKEKGYEGYEVMEYCEVIFVDIQNEKPVFLCMSDGGDLYICTLEQQGNGFKEKDIKRISDIDAQIFIANSSVKAREKINKIP